MLMVAVAWWTGAVAVEHLSSQVQAKIFWAEMAWPGIAATGYCWGLFIWDYVQGRHRPVPLIVYWALTALSLLAWITALTNDFHHLMYPTTTVVTTATDFTLKFAHGPLFFAFVATLYFSMLLSEVVLLYAIQNSQGVYRFHYYGFVAASLLPWIVNILYLSGSYTLTAFDPTPFSIVAMTVIFYWLIDRRQLFDLVPIAHRSLLDALPDAVLVIDTEARIVDYNPAARDFVGGKSLVGKGLGGFLELQTLAGLVSHDHDPGGQPREIVLGNPDRTFEVGKVTLTYGNRAVGQLLLLRDVSHRKKAEQRLQAALGELETQLQNNLILQKQLREQSVRDALTGLYNRHFLNESAPELLTEAERTGHPLIAVMIDLDHFKQLNDHYGHAAGDTVLRAVGNFLRQNVRESDLVIRMGGEEFLVLLPNMLEDAMDRVETWREAFGTQSFFHEGVLPLKATFSAGIAFSSNGGLMDLLRRADLALYRAKLEGRNRCVLWQPEGAVP